MVDNVIKFLVACIHCHRDDPYSSPHGLGKFGCNLWVDIAGALREEDKADMGGTTGNRSLHHLRCLQSANFDVRFHG